MSNCWSNAEKVLIAFAMDGRKHYQDKTLYWWVSWLQGALRHRSRESIRARLLKMEEWSRGSFIKFKK